MEPPTSLITVRLLGRFEAAVDGVVISDFRYAKVRALLALLCTERQPLPRSRLAGLLWADQPEARARASLSQALTTLRRAIGDPRRDRPVIGADAMHAWIDVAADVDIDVEVVSGLLDACDWHAHPRLRSCRDCGERLKHAVDRYRGDFLADVEIPDSDLFERWAADHRHQLRQRAATALTRLAERAEWLGAGAEAVAYARRLVALDPLVEANHRMLIQLLLTGGEVAAAQTQYAAMESLLEEHLDVAPQPATLALRAEIAAGRASRPNPVRRVSVPVPAQPLVGRAAELDGLLRRFLDDGARAITVTGSGGVGKTRLAIEAATALAEHFDDGAVFVDLSAVDSDALVATTVADVLGVSDREHRDVAEALASELAAQHLLLVLDNFEQVLAAAPLVAGLLQRCPSLTVLATSRLPLGISAEHQVVLEPLQEDDAVALFAACAKGAGARGLEGPAVLADCREICRRVDGLPLAIELVAAGARFRPPAALLAELDHPLALASRSCDVPARHRTMRAAIQWSVDLLDEPTRCLFARLAAFAGGWTPDAARALALDIDDVDRRLDVLLQANMIRQSGGRMSMLVTFRQFAAEQLDTHPAGEQVRDRHAAYFAGVAGAAADGLLSPSARAWIERISVEQDNMRAAYGHAMNRGHTEQALVIAAGPWRYHWMRGLVRDALDRVLGALAAAGPVASDVRSVALRAAGTLAVAAGNFSLATELLEQAVTVAREAGDRLMVQSALTNLGLARAEQGEIQAAIDALDQSLCLARELDGRKAKFPLGVLAAAHSRLGNFALASELAAEGLRLNRQLDDPEGTADGLRTLAVAVHGLGDDAMARRLAAEALARHRALDHDVGIGLDLAVLGDFDSAAGLIEAARDHYHDCLRRWRSSGNPVHSARVLDQLAVLLAPTDPSRAVELFAVAGATRDRAGARLAVDESAAIDSARERCRVALGDARFHAARSCGRALTIGQAIDLALCR